MRSLNSSIINHQFLSSAGNGRQERDLVSRTEDRTGRRVLAVDRRGGRAAQAREERDLRGELPPERRHVGSLRQLPLLLVPAGGLAERGEIEDAYPHAWKSIGCGIGRNRPPRLRKPGVFP